MCHGFDSRDWSREIEDEPEEKEEEADMPSFAKDEPADAEILTDGGDDE